MRTKFYNILGLTIILLTIMGCFVETQSNPQNIVLELVLEEPAGTNSIISISDSTYEWEHWDYQLNADNTIQPLKPDNERVKVTEIYNSKIIENDYLKVTLLPEVGGRIMSIYYKPTGHELLYQNPIGTPYGYGNSTFYYSWLMVLGGIFPTFPFPEHGKAWLLPWDTEITLNTEEQISFKMSFTDTIDLRGDATDMTCEATVSVYKDSSFVDLGIKLINNRNSTIAYEYWTCTTLAPGSIPGDTKCPVNSRIVAPISQYSAGWSPQDWISASSDFSTIDELHEWPDMGIGYGVNLTENWWGVINHDNNEGIFRIGDNINHTPGLKFWTWGSPDSPNFDSRDPSVYVDVDSRPFIEPWAGVSLRFFTSAYLEGNETKTWIESYIPTVGLDDVSFANKYGSVNLTYSVNGDAIDFSAKIFTTLPDRGFRLLAQTDNGVSYNTSANAYTTQGDTPTVITFSTPKASSLENYTIILRDEENNILLEKSISIEL